MGFLDYFRQPAALTNLKPEEVKGKIDSGTSEVIDVRTKGEFNRSHINGAVSNPLSAINNIIDTRDKRTDIVLICATGHRSRAAAAKLIKNGFSSVSHLEGGMRSWNKAQKENKRVKESVK